MNPGKELDALIAEKVMGYETEIINGDPVSKVPGICGTEGCAIHFTKTPHYSTDIAAAWEVVEKLQLKFKTIDIVATTRSDTYVGPCFVIFDPYGNVLSDSSEAPHAICLAALKVVGYEEEA